MRAQLKKVEVESDGDVVIHALGRDAEWNDPKRMTIRVWVETDGKINLHLSGLETEQGGNQITIKTKFI